MCNWGAAFLAAEKTYFKRLDERDTVTLTAAGEIHFVPVNGQQQVSVEPSTQSGSYSASVKYLYPSRCCLKGITKKFFKDRAAADKGEAE